MSQALSLAIQNILQNSDIFNRSRETVLFTPFGDKKVTQVSGFLPTSVSYVRVTRTTFYEISKISHICSIFRKSICIRVAHRVETLKIYE